MNNLEIVEDLYFFHQTLTVISSILLGCKIH